MPIGINEGTQTFLTTTTSGTERISHVRADGGTIGVVFAGTTTLVSTVTTLSNLTNGSVRMTVGTLTTGTLQNLVSGTINSGTVDSLNIGRRHADEFATLVSTGTNTLGTIRAGVAGSAIYVTHLVVSVGTASNVVIGNGGTSLPLLGTLFFSTNGGIADTPIDPPLRTSSGSALVYQQSVGGPMTIQAGGYID